ncbi:MAG: hypothetical protein DHS20C18_42910 [Saprospiraceae bacterium]|nr:MAG: hypothetical protein DHS20C18_42910 [Saprospiraceae bacterium]
MQNKPNLFIVCILSWSTLLSAQQDPNQLFYIRQYKDIAIREMIRTGIPASITLAQAVLESNAGQSELAQMATNHFGIKCGNNWTGGSYYKEDDDYNMDGQLISSCFRSYPNVDASFQDHSDFLTDPKKEYRYGPLFKFDNTDYQSWAYGLKEAGYATNPTYPDLLIQLIQRYKLYEYDLVFPLTPDTISAGFPPLITTTNDVPHTFASGYETALDIAIRTNTPLEDLLAFNERLVDGYVLSRGEKIYLATKRRRYTGPLQYHEVETGETIYDIAQKYGVRVTRLIRRNKLLAGQKLAVGQLIKLYGSRVKNAQIVDPNVDTGFDEDLFKEENQPVNPDISPPVKVESPSNLSPDKTVTPSQSAVYHTVEINDTLWNIARQYNTKVEELIRLNNLNDNTIQRGMQLRIR